MNLFWLLFWLLQLAGQRQQKGREQSLLAFLAPSQSQQIRPSRAVGTRGGMGAINPNILADKLTLLSIVSQTEGWGRCPPHYNHLPSHHISGPSYGPAPSFMYAAKNKNYFSEKKETVVVSLVRDSVIQSVILILACFYKTHGDRMSCEELAICYISCISNDVNTICH